MSARTLGGQRRRICIARAQAPEPKLIIADKAVSALHVSVPDPAQRGMRATPELRGLKTLLRPVDQPPPARGWTKVAPGQLVTESHATWSG